MDNRKILICVIILFVVIIAFLIIALNMIGQDSENKVNNNYTNNMSNTNQITYNNLINNEIEEKPSNEISHNDNVILDATDYFDVTINSVYYTIENIANDFFKTINIAFDENSAKQFFSEEVYLSGMKEKEEKLYALLGNEYISKLRNNKRESKK